MLLSIQKRTQALLFLALLLVTSGASACSQTIAPTTNNTTTGNKLIVYIVGLGEHLDTKDDRTKATFYGLDGIEPYLQEPGGKFHDAASMFYSYRGLDSGTPGTFPCTDTYNNNMFDDENKLNLEITSYLTSHPNTQVYLVSHSLGGVIAFGFMAQLIEATHKNALLHGGSLQGVAILDSPLNGVTRASNYEKAMVGLSLRCSGGSMLSVDYTSISELQTVGDTGQFNGDKASILGTLLQGRFVPNQQVAEHAANAGIRILIVGNTHDLLWQPGFCGLGPNFLSTQYLSEVGKTGSGALYVRAITVPSGDLDTKTECSLSKLYNEHAHHFVVTTDGGVKKAIEQVFLGQDLNVLTPVTDSTSPAELPTPTPTPAPILRGAYFGTITNQTTNLSSNMALSFDNPVYGDGPCSGNFRVDPPLYGSGRWQGTVSGSTIQFTVTPDNQAYSIMSFVGTVSNGTMSGTYIVNGNRQQGTWQV